MSARGGRRELALLLALAGCAGCGGDGGGADDDAGADARDTSIDASADGRVMIDAAVDAAPAAALLEERFTGAAWTGWQALGGVASATVVGGRGRLVPVVSGYSLGRMGHALGARDVEVTFTLELTDPGRQGVGFYVRQNGGYLQQGAPHGAGFAVFVEAFRGPRLGLWHERDGVEEELIGAAVPGGLAATTAYAVRFRCTQAGATTALAARIWPVGQAEPTTWLVEATDPLAALQGVAGGVAVDAWNTATTAAEPAPAPIFVDDIVVRAAP